VCGKTAQATREFVTSIVNRNDMLPYLAHQTASGVLSLLSPAAALGALVSGAKPAAAGSDSSACVCVELVC
jgi:hypothetical protein